ncbi:hypothetical protein D3H55_14105 [Bacillus salacetis]|uniref:DUF4181 domain-containing protein n=1 Tax=Bacillus salacetis TaxID=2315464 RepID=A0A3A1QV09_9BACI|nr:hypothetical protein [Bacillus salacetis]RIW32009.1 hypothetical protein D3H55_14105 [Bacillus salacetis]
MTQEARTKISPGIIAFYIVMVALLLIAAKSLFDEHPGNDISGWLVLILIWTLKGAKDFFEYRKKGDMKTAIFNLLIATAGIGLILWQAISFLS